MEGEENILNQKLLEGEENIKLNNHVFPPIFYFFLHLVLFFLLVVLSFQSFVLEPYLRPSLLLPIFESPHTKKKKKKKKKKRKKEKKLSEENKKYIVVRREHKNAQKMAQDWLRKFKNIKIEI
jgi:hypothetical protein